MIEHNSGNLRPGRVFHEVSWNLGEVRRGEEIRGSND